MKSIKHADGETALLRLYCSVRSNTLMKTPRTVLLAWFIVLAITTHVEAKCPLRRVTIEGVVAPSLTGLHATVALVMKKKSITKTVPVSESAFSADVMFWTYSSSSFLGGDRCNTVPRRVEVSIFSADKVYVRKTLAFKEHFAMTPSREYRLKRPLSLEIRP